jgi:hypothetical protein
MTGTRRSFLKRWAVTPAVALSSGARAVAGVSPPERSPSRSSFAGRADRDLTVEYDGGELSVAWPEGGTVRQTGEVEVLFDGDGVGTA